jgi:tetratricopeptide (TPR) repeat protein
MDTPPTSLKEQGSQALRNQDLDRAVDFLARAVMADDNDVDAKALLGVAYSQKGMHSEAKRALSTAVDRQPQNSNFRFNLGVVLERAGDMQGAAIAYRDTLHANPQHEQAKARLAAMGPQGQALLASAPKPIEPVGVPGPNQSPVDAFAPPANPQPAPSYGPPPGSQPGASPFATPPPQGGHQPGAPFAPPPPMGQQPGGPFAPSMAGQAPIAPQAPPGTVQCPRCGQFSRIGMTCEFCASPMAPPPRPSSPAHQPQQYSPVGMGMGGYNPAMKPHRATTVLVLGIVGLLLCGICGIFAWIYGNKDLAEMDAGIMDPSGRSTTQIGRVLGMVTVGLMVIGFLFTMLSIVIGIGSAR